MSEENTPQVPRQRQGVHFQAATDLVALDCGGFSDELQALCKERDFPVLHKPFLAQDVLNLVRGRFSKATTVAAV